MIYEYPDASDEPLDIIRKNECENQRGSLVTKRFQAFWNAIERLRDKVEGLDADLDAAVEVAFKHGAEEWVRLNYPEKYARLKLANPATPEQRENIAPPEKPHIVTSYYHEFVMTPDTIDIEDQGMAMIVYADPDTPESDPDRMAVRLQSWDETKKHEQLRAFADKRITISIEAFNV
ncbi:hypothetical protein EVC24_006 [Rhizobium phage RHph_I4]|nr:hypothetical protein EVC24_006 [Rhizobium phage RHph_I4]